MRPGATRRPGRGRPPRTRSRTPEKETAQTTARPKETILPSAGQGKEDASLFFRLVSLRYGRGSVLITTNKGIKDWPEILAGDEVLATAILDRLLHRSHVLNIRGRSYRLRDLEQAAASRT